MVADAPPTPRVTTFESSRAPGDAELRITRQFAIFAGAGYLAYGLLTLGNMAKSFDYMASWWAIGGPILVFGSGIAIGVVAAVGAVQLVRPTIVVAALSYLVVALLVPVAWRHGVYSDERGLWFSQFPGLVGVAVGLGWPRLRAVLYLFVLTTVATTMSRVVRPSELIVQVGPDLAFAFAYSLPFVMAVIIGVRTSRILDQTRAATFEVAGRTAAERARAAERRRFDALTHDGVMTVLLAAARTGTTESIQHLAATTISELRGTDDGTAPIPSAAAVAQLQSTVTDIDDRTTFTVVRSGPVGLTTYPRDVVRTLAAATAEALRNSIRHAGHHATSHVSATIGADRLHIEIADDGQGFDIDAIPPHRLGIAVSIRGRLEQLPGGGVAIESAPGEGTRVTLSWADRRP